MVIHSKYLVNRHTQIVLLQLESVKQQMLALVSEQYHSTFSCCRCCRREYNRRVREVVEQSWIEQES